MDRKSLIIKLSVTLAGLLLVLTFFSNTIHNLNVAGVVVGFDTTGIVISTHQEDGFVKFPDFKNIYSEHSGKINILVEDGEYVHEGTPLFEIQGDRVYIIERIATLSNLIHSLPYTNWAEIRREIAQYQELLNTDMKVTTYANEDGYARFIEETPEDNWLVNSEQIIMKLDMKNEGSMMVVLYFPESLGIEPEDMTTRNVRLIVPTMDERHLPAQIEEIVSAEGRLRATILFDPLDHEFIGGERAEVNIEDISVLVEQMLPNYAIREDELGEFILVVTREENMFFGYSYYANRVDIMVFQRGDRDTSFVSFLNIEEPIILQSDRPIEEGDRIRVVGER
jgi:hypothetical protein